MSDQPKLVACPLCSGQGALSPVELVDLFSNAELRKRFDERITQIADLCNPVSAASKGKMDFQKEVHTWNPTLPIWRRSSKE